MAEPLYEWQRERLELKLDLRELAAAASAEGCGRVLAAQRAHDPLAVLALECEVVRGVFLHRA